MFCQRYKESLSEAAVTLPAGELEPGDAAVPALSAELRAHLADCPACRAQFDAQRALMGAIDRGIQVSLAAEPSPEFAARVRRRLEEERLPSQPWFSGWVPAAAGALAVLALVAVWLARREPVGLGTNDSARNVQSQPNAVNNAGVPPESYTAQSLPPQSIGKSATTRGAVPAPQDVRPAVAKAEPEVLVPPGQREAILRLYAALQSGRTNAASLLAEAGSLQPAELKIPPLEVARLDLEPQSPEATRNR